AEPRTVIYVTHDIDEAIYLADRIAIMTPSPGHVGRYVTVDLERPRDRNSAQANALRTELTEIMHRLGRVEAAAPAMVGGNNGRNDAQARAVIGCSGYHRSRHRARRHRRYRALRRAPSEPDHGHSRDRQTHRRL